ncbi:MAG: heparinase, partial [Parasphingorhabdus sp.]
MSTDKPDRLDLGDSDPDGPATHDENDAAGEGRSLTLRHDKDRGQSLAEQATMLYYRMTWRMPMHRLRLSGKLP